MAKNNLSATELKRLLSYDPETGFFTWIVGRGSAKIGAKAGATARDNYVVISVGGKLHRAHRLAVLYMLGRFPADGIEVDHVNCVRSDNRWANLREVTASQNQHNRKNAPKQSTTGLLGASRPNKEGRYRACIKVHGKTIHLGTHDTPELAHEAYMNAKARLHHPVTV
jgi:hypothetical protein